MLGFIKNFYHKLLFNWNYFKAGNRDKRFLFFYYLFWALCYRRLVCNLVAVPLALLYFATYPFIKIRFIKLIGSALGHFSVTTELLLTNIDAIQEDKFFNVFYLEHSLFEQSISNLHLYKMWKRKIFILPLQFSGIVICLDKFIMRFLRNKAYDLSGVKTRYETRWVRDPDGHLKNKAPQLQFTEVEHKQAERLLEKINMKAHDRYVCLFLRSNAYNKGHPTWHYPERNVDIKTYMKACYFLAEKGYYVLRMGKVVDDSVPLQHPRIIDYAKSEIRSDFMDIYLSAHCFFFITTGSGLDGIPQIFRKPILYTNCFILPHIATWYPHYLFTSKHIMRKQTNELLSFQEQIYYFHTHPEFAARKNFHVAAYVEKHQLAFVDNSEDELLEIVQEMEARMTNTWQETTSQRSLQNKFWDMFNLNLQPTPYQDKHKPLHGEIFIKMGSHFLSRYQHLLS